MLSLKLQRSYKRHARERLSQRTSAAATSIAAVYRGHAARCGLAKYHVAIVRLQAAWRGRVARKYKYGALVVSLIAAARLPSRCVPPGA